MKAADCIVVLCVAFLNTAAIAADLPTDTRDFETRVEREVTVGMAIDTAKDRLETLGLECKPVAKGWTNNVRDSTPFLFCSRSSGTLVLTRWQVALLPREGKVAEIRSNVGFVGP